MYWAHTEHVTEGKTEDREDKEENVSSYRMTFRRREGTGTCKRKHRSLYAKKTLGKGYRSVARQATLYINKNEVGLQEWRCRCKYS